MVEAPLANIAYAAAASPVAVALLNKIADVIGWTMAPHQLIRLAKAQASAALIAAESDAQAQNIISRAATRSLLEDIIEQEIIENIVAKALSTLHDTATPSSINNDWLANLFAKCRTTSDEQMQNTWARILAGEANNPGSFSRKTVNIVADLDKDDATAFIHFCNFTWRIRELPRPLIYDLDHEIYATTGMNKGVCSHLASLGLVDYTDPIISWINVQEGEEFSYHDQVRILTETNSQSRLITGHAGFTLAGFQLYQICDTTPADEFYDYVLGEWESQGIKTVLK